MRNLTKASRTVLVLIAGAVAFAVEGNAAQQATSNTLAHDVVVASALTCGGGVFEFEGTNPDSRYSYSVRDGAQIMVSVAHRLGWSRVTQALMLGDDGAWLEKQFKPGSYDLKEDANKSITSTAYLLGQYARHYCVEHPFDTLADAIENVVHQVQTKPRD